MGRMVGARFGYTPNTRGQLRNIEGTFTRSGPMIMASAELAVAAVAKAYEENVRKEFEPHEANRRGNPEGSPLTIDTLETKIHGFGAELSMGGASEYIYRGWAEHQIEAKEAFAMAWGDDGGGETQFAHSVTVPAHDPDPYWDRAVKETNVEGLLRRSFRPAFVEMAAAVEKETP